MRLLYYDQTDALQVSDDLHDGEKQAYAILSHTWASDHEEVSLSDLTSGSYKSKQGYQKLQFCGQQAQKDGMQRFWIDTCCIDKPNHTELSSAIISMFRWYQNAQICYVFLTDVSFTPDEERASSNLSHNRWPRWESSFRKSRWFTRGWTLQELLAPKNVVFYSREGHKLGTKTGLADILHEITSIPRSALQGKELSHFPVDDRMRWRLGRSTKLKEDEAYCLAGIFGVILKPCYGEGDHAFRRLEEKINKRVAVRPSGSSNTQSRYQGLGKIMEDNREQVSQLPRMVPEATGRMLQQRLFPTSTNGVTNRNSSKTKTYRFSFGRVKWRRTLSDRHSLDATFMPAQLFWQTSIHFWLEYSLRHENLFVPRLCFMQVIKDDHPLILASVGGDLETLQDAFDSCVASFCCTADGWTLLHYAAAYGQLAVCRLLLHQRAPINVTGDRGVTPLHLAAHFGHEEVFRLLVEAGADPDDYHEHGSNAIHEILSSGLAPTLVHRTAFWHWLLEGQQQHYIDAQCQDTFRRTILYHLANPPRLPGASLRALTDGQRAAISCILKRGVTGDERDYHQISLLHEACRDGRMDLVQLLLPTTRNINAVDKTDGTPLGHAVTSGDIDLVTLLLDNNADVNYVVNKDVYNLREWYTQTSPLSLAAKNGNMAMIRLLVKRGAQRNDSNVNRAFHVALCEHSADVARYFLENAKSQLDLRQAVGAANDWPDMIEVLHGAGAPLDARYMDYWTPLVTAIRNGWTDVVETLVRLSVDLSQTVGHLPNPQPPLQWAVDSGYADIVSILLKAGAHKGLHYERILALKQHAAKSGYEEIASLIAARISEIPVSSEEKLDSRDNVVSREASQEDDVKTDFTTACCREDLAVVQKLLQKRGHTDRGATDLPLTIAIDRENLEMTRLLIDAGAELNYCGHNGCHPDHPFMHAIHKGNQAIIDLMIAHEADVNVRDCYGMSPLLICLSQFWTGYARKDPAKSRYFSDGTAVRALLRAGAFVHAVDKHGHTALGMAAALGNLQEVVALVEAGAELNRPSSQNAPDAIRYKEKIVLKAPIAWAAEYGHDRVVRYLYDHRAEWRGLRDEPMVWHTHRLLMKLRFPQTNFPNLSRKRGTTEYGPPTGQGNAQTKQLATSIKETPMLDGQNQCPHHENSTLPRMESKFVRVTHILRARVQSAYNAIQHMRLEVVALVCVLSLLIVQSVRRHVSKHGLESIRLAAFAMLAGILICEWQVRGLGSLTLLHDIGNAWNSQFMSDPMSSKSSV